jgi:flagellar biosynthesis protein FliP
LIALMTVLSLAPLILVMMTSFTHIIVVLSLLRSALGTATAPPNSVVISLALFLTALMMGPVLTRSYDAGVKPLVANEITVDEALNRASGPLRGFMEKNVRDKTCNCSSTCRGRRRRQSRKTYHARAGAGLHDLRAQARVRDLLPAVPALPDHRPSSSRRY